MKKSLAVVFMLAMAPAAFAQAITRRSPVGEPPADVRSGRATALGRFTVPTQMRRLAFALVTPRPDEEEQFLQELITPGSPQFHKFLTADQWNARFSPTEEDEQAVMDWATSQGMTITHRFPNRLIVNVEAPMGTIERALQVRINYYQVDGYTYFANEREPVLPARVSHLIRDVAGLHNFPLMHPKAAHGAPLPPGPLYTPGAAAGEPRRQHADGDRAKYEEVQAGLRANVVPTPNLTSGNYDPTDIYAPNAYNYTALQNQGHCCNPNHLAGGSPPQASIAIAAYGNLQFTGSFPNATFTDINGFQAQYPYLAYNITAITVDGGPGFCTVTPTQPCNADLETTLDTEWSIATANSFGSFLDTAHVFVYEGEGGYPGNVYNQILSDAHAKVLTSSFSCGNPTGESNCPSGTVSSLHSIFNSMVGQGWTIMTASGDAGATADCATTSVEYPASDPDIVGVGGTTLTSGGSGAPFSSEVAWTGGTGAGSCTKNNGGSTGGCSTLFPVPSFQTGFNGTCGTKRGVPDISLNANFGQNMFFNGKLLGIGGTSIASPMVAGFFAQEGAYLLHLDNVTGHNCGTLHLDCLQVSGGMGNGNAYLYQFGKNPFFAPHYPFYDITSGCNSNDITASKSLTSFCAGTGYDLVTGWGTANMLQLGWAMNTFLAGDSGAPAATFSGPAIGHWNNTPKNVNWTLADTSSNGAVPNGVAGFSRAWDVDPGDVYLGSRSSTNNSYFTGPQVPNATTGFLTLNNSLEGCHTTHVRAWDNGGTSSDSTYGPVCFDDIPPREICASPDGLWHPTDVLLHCTASDTLSGLANPADASFNLTTSVPANTETSNAFTNSRTILDIAGNSSTAGPIGGNKVDKKGPSVTCGVPDGVWHANNVSIPCTSADGGSGLANPADASFNLTTSVPAGVETATAATNSRTVLDAVGNRATAGPISPNMIDRKPPVITIVQPMVALYSHGTTLVLNYSVTDGGSGVGLVVATMNGAPTVGGNPLTNGQTISFLSLPLGMNTFAITATDNVGNTSSASVTFTIIATFQDTLNDIDSLLAQFLIDNSTTAHMLKQEILAAQSATGFDRINLLNQFLSNVASLAGKSIFGKAVQILQDDANSLWSFQTPAARPIANAGPNQTVAQGSTVHLDGSQSTNPTLTLPVTYSWSFAMRPAGSVAVLTSATTVNPTFVPDVAGTYVITLRYSNGLDVSFASVSVTAN